MFDLLVHPVQQQQRSYYLQRALWHYRSPIGLVGNHIDVLSGKWTSTDAGIGAGVDSYYEYLVKVIIILYN